MGSTLPPGLAARQQASHHAEVLRFSVHVRELGVVVGERLGDAGLDVAPYRWIVGDGCFEGLVHASE